MMGANYESRHEGVPRATRNGKDEYWTLVAIQETPLGSFDKRLLRPEQRRQRPVARQSLKAIAKPFDLLRSALVQSVPDFELCDDRLIAVKWRNWKLHFYRQDTMFDPLVKNPVPTIFNLYTDPREEKPAVDTWVVNPMLKMVGAFEESVKKYPLIPMGTPDPYTPPKQ